MAGFGNLRRAPSLGHWATPTRLLGGLLVAVLMSSCKMIGSASSTKSELISGPFNDTAVLGQGYDSSRKKILNNICVTGTGDPVIQGNASGELKYEQDMSYDSIVKKIDNDWDSGANLVLTQASNTVQVAIDSSSDDRSETHMIYWIGANRKRIFPNGKMVLTPQGKDFVATAKDRLQGMCGDSFVSEIAYGASLFATMKIEYMNVSDKFLAGGSFNMDLAAGVFKSNENLQKIDQNLKKRTKVAIVVRQIGGNPTALMRVLPANAIACSLDDLQPCMDTLNAVIGYMRGEFKSNLDTGGPGGWNALQLSVSRYDNSGLEVLTPSKGFLVVDDATRVGRKNLETRYVAESTNAALAQSIAQKATVFPYLSDDYLRRIQNIYQDASSNADMLANVQVACYEDVLNCARLASDTLGRMPVYDASILSVDLARKQTVGNLNYYAIVGGYKFGRKYDDTKSAAGTSVVQIDLAAANIVGGSTLNNATDTRLSGIRITYGNHAQVTHGVLNPKTTQSLDLRNDAVVGLTTCFDAGSDILTPRVTGLSFLTSGGKKLSLGNLLSSKCSNVMFPAGETFIGVAGSSGAEVDSLGAVTQTSGGL